MVKSLGVPIFSLHCLEEIRKRRGDELFAFFFPHFLVGTINLWGGAKKALVNVPMIQFQFHGTVNLMHPNAHLNSLNESASNFHRGYIY